MDFGDDQKQKKGNDRERRPEKRKKKKKKEVHKLKKLKDKCDESTFFSGERSCLACENGAVKAVCVDCTSSCAASDGVYIHLAGLLRRVWGRSNDDELENT